MTDTERKAIYVKVLRMLDERKAMPWWAWNRRAEITRRMQELLDSAL